MVYPELEMLLQMWSLDGALAVSEDVLGHVFKNLRLYAAEPRCYQTIVEHMRCHLLTCGDPTQECITGTQ